MTSEACSSRRSKLECATNYIHTAYSIVNRVGSDMADHHVGATKLNNDGR